MRLTFISICMILLSFSAQARELTLEERMGELENRLMVLEQAMSEKMNGCTLVYRHQAYRYSRCDQGTFVRSVTQFNSGSLQLECGYYQLKCPTTQK